MVPLRGILWCLMCAGRVEAEEAGTTAESLHHHQQQHSLLHRLLTIEWECDTSHYPLSPQPRTTVQRAAYFAQFKVDIDKYSSLLSADMTRSRLLGCVWVC